MGFQERGDSQVELVQDAVYNDVESHLQICK